MIRRKPAFACKCWVNKALLFQGTGSVLRTSTLLGPCVNTATTFPTCSGRLARTVSKSSLLRSLQVMVTTQYPVCPQCLMSTSGLLCLGDLHLHTPVLTL